MYRVGQKAGPFCFAACNIINIDQIYTKFGTFILIIIKFDVDMNDKYFYSFIHSFAQTENNKSTRAVNESRGPFTKNPKIFLSLP